METKTISQLRSGDIAQNFFLIKAADCKTSSNNKKYLDLTLADRSGEINAKIWDLSNGEDSIYIANTLVKVRGSINEWQNKLQLKIEKIRLATNDDGVDVGDFVPVAPHSADYMYGVIEDYINKIKNNDIKNIVSAIITDNKEKLMIYPAAKQNHHSVRSGLLYHIMTMLNMGEKVAEVYTHLNTDFIFAGVILHDMAKLAEMNASELGIVSEYTVEGELLGHIIQGIKMIDRAAEIVGADKEITMLLEHMILSHHYEPEYGSPKRPMIPEAEILHYLDIIDARMYDMQKALGNIEAGKFTDRLWLLENRKLYKTTVEE